MAGGWLAEVELDFRGMWYRYYGIMGVVITRGLDHPDVWFLVGLRVALTIGVRCL